MLNKVLKNCLKFSTYIEKVTPRIIPKIVADVPIITPTRKKIFTIDFLSTPIDFNIAISFVFFLTSTNGNLTVGDDNLSKDAAYFTGEGLLSINKALCKGNKSLFISSALLLFIFFDNSN